MKLFKTKCKDTVHACVNAFGCFFVSNIVKEMKRKFLQKIILSKKSLAAFDQFLSMAERQIDII